MVINKRDEGKKVNSNINVTPMVDVMLVLLIIFMVITPMLNNKVNVDLPQATAAIVMENANKEDAVTIAVTRDGRPVMLHPSLFPLLRLFVEHPLTVLSRRAIVAKLRDTPVGYSERSLDVLVWRLRQVLEPDPSLPRFIQTIRGRGYVFSPSGTGSHPAAFDEPDATPQAQPASRRTDPHPQAIPL